MSILLQKLKIISSNSCFCLLTVIQLLVTSSSLLPTATALSTSSSSKPPPPPPPPRSSIPTTSQKISNTQCRILLDIGRVTGTAMPPEWAASGARLVLPDVDLRFEEKVYRYGYSENEERLLGYGYDPPPLEVDVLSMPKFVGSKGEETVQITKGGYALKSPPEGDDRWPGIAVRFFLDFPDGAIRNDVTLPAERVFFTTKCWVDDSSSSSSTTTTDTSNSNRKGEFESAMDRLRTTKEEYERIGKEILNYDEKEKEEEVQRVATTTTNTNGKKRDSGGDDSGGGRGGMFGMFRRATGFRSRVQLSERRTILKRRVEIMERALPPLSSFDGDGMEKGENTVVRSSDGVIFEKEGYMTVKRYGGLLGTREEYHIVGKFLITEILDSATTT